MESILRPLSLSRILAVDDDLNSLLLVDTALTAAGHQVVTCGRGDAALALLEEQPFDALVLDLLLPEVPGLEVLKALRGKPATRSLPVLILSARGESGDRVRGLREGANDYLAKPWDSEELVLRVDRLLQKGASPSALAGDLAIYPPWHLLQSVSGTSGSGRLLLSCDIGQGAMTFSGGQLVEASLGGLSGDEAVVAALDVAAGRFRFQREDQVSAVAVSKRTRAALGSILLHHAWLKDELARRSELLPRDDQPLELASATVPPLPESFELLPVARVLARIKPKSRTSIDSLEREQVVAPLTLRLIVALLIELGTLVALPGAEETVVRDERFAAAVERFLAAAARRRPKASKQRDAQVLLAAEPGAWEALLGLCAPLYQSQAPAERERLRVQLAIQRRGSFRLADGAGQLDVHIQVIDPGSVSQVEALAGVSQGVAVWLEGDSPSESTRRLAKSASAGLLLCHDAEPAAVAALAQELAPWQPLLSRPQSLATLFEIMG